MKSQIFRIILTAILGVLFSNITLADYTITSGETYIDSEGNCMYDVNVSISGNAGPFNVYLFSNDDLDNPIDVVIDAQEGILSFDGINTDEDFTIKIVDNYKCNWLSETLYLQCPCEFLEIESTVLNTTSISSSCKEDKLTTVFNKSFHTTGCSDCCQIGINDASDIEIKLNGEINTDIVVSVNFKYQCNGSNWEFIDNTIEILNHCENLEVGDLIEIEPKSWNFDNPSDCVHTDEFYSIFKHTISEDDLLCCPLPLAPVFEVVQSCNGLDLETDCQLESGNSFYQGFFIQDGICGGNINCQGTEFVINSSIEIVEWDIIDCNSPSVVLAATETSLTFTIDWQSGVNPCGMALSAGTCTIFPPFPGNALNGITSIWALDTNGNYYEIILIAIGC